MLEIYICIHGNTLRRHIIHDATWAESVCTTSCLAPFVSFLLDDTSGIPGLVMNGHRSRRQPSSAVVARCNLEPRAIRILPRSFPNATVVVEGFLFSLLLKQRKNPSARLVLRKQASLTRRQPADQPSGAASSKQKSPRQIRKRNPFPRRAAKADFRCPGPLPPPAHCTVIAKPLAHLTGRRADPPPLFGALPDSISQL